MPETKPEIKPSPARPLDKVAARLKRAMKAGKNGSGFGPEEAKAFRQYIAQKRAALKR